jgi:hypothetical protein
MTKEWVVVTWKAAAGLKGTKKNAFYPATALHATVALSFVIPSVPGFPTSPLLPATAYVVLPKENHMQLIEAATLDRKSGGAEGSAVPRTFPGNVFRPERSERSWVPLS